MSNNELTLRPLEDADVALFTEWLNKDYILKWYTAPAEWLAEVNGRRGEYAWIHHFIVMEGGAPIGFCQYCDCYDAGEIEDWYNALKPGDTYSIDYLIGEESRLGKGYGKAIVQLLTKAVAKIPGAKQIIVQPDAENHASNGVLLANGYTYDAAKKYYYKLLLN